MYLRMWFKKTGWTADIAANDDDDGDDDDELLLWEGWRPKTSVFPLETIARKSHQRDFSTRRGGNRSRIAETAIRSDTTTTPLKTFWA